MRQKVLWLFLSCLMALTLAAWSCGCTTSEPELPFAQKLQDAVDAGLEKYDGGMGGTPGITVAVIVPGYRTWLGVTGISYGVSPVTPDTLFAAGSIGKSFTAAVILQLEEEGVLSLDDQLHKWLPDYANIDNTITIRQLLAHTSGIYNFTDNYAVLAAFELEPERLWNPEEVVVEFVREPYFPKGTDWRYSNSGYLLLGMIIKEATGSEPFNEYRNRLWTPLGLDNTFLAIDEELPENTAHGWYDLDWDFAYDEVSVSSGPALCTMIGVAGGWFSTAEDLAKWARALFCEGRVLSEQSLNQMLAFPPIARLYGVTPFIIAEFGLGVMRLPPECFNGVEIWGHAGGVPGYRARSLYLPDYGVSIGIATNTDGGEAMGIINDLLSIITSHIEPTP